jgi:hypothetical protein
MIILWPQQKYVPFAIIKTISVDDVFTGTPLNVNKLVMVVVVRRVLPVATLKI